MQPSIIRGLPLAKEPGVGALTLGGWLEEVTTRFGPRWTYAELWDQAQAVGRALVA